MLAPMRRSHVTLLLLLFAMAFALTACGDDEGGGGGEDASKPTPAAAEETPAEPSGCEKAEAPKPKKAKVGKPTEKLSGSKTYVARVTTSCGEFEITLDVKRAPKTSGSFAHLAKEGFYDGTSFHRIVPGFVIQGGDPQGTGTGGPGYSVVEAPPEELSYTRGIVAMAKTGSEKAGTSGSQFFVVTGEDAQLPPDYALLGEVTTGQEVVDTIGTQETDPSTESPVTPIIIEKVEIEES